MSDAELQRLQRDIEDLVIRVRAVENVDSPLQRRIVGEFVELQRRVDRLDREGTASLQAELRDLHRTVERLERDMSEKASREALEFELQRISDLEEEQKVSRRGVRAAILAGLIALGGSFVLFLIERALSR